MNNLKSYLITGLIAVVVAVGLGSLILPHKSFGGTVETYPDWFYNGLSAGNATKTGTSGSAWSVNSSGAMTVNGITNTGSSTSSGNNTHTGNETFTGTSIFTGPLIASLISQATTGIAALGDVIQNSGITSIATSTNISANQFCAGGMYQIATSTTANITLTLPSLSQIASSSCASSIFSGSFQQNQIVNQSNFDVTVAASGTGESLVFGQGTSAILAPGHSWINFGQFVNSSYVQGATASGTTLNVYLIDTQPTTATNSAASTTQASALGSAWLGHIVIPAGQTSAWASTTAVTSLNSLINLTQELTSPIPGTTCNATPASSTLVSNLYNASTTLTGFSFKVGGAAPVTNPYCFQFTVDN